MGRLESFCKLGLLADKTNLYSGYIYLLVAFAAGSVCFTFTEVVETFHCTQLFETFVSFDIEVIALRKYS